MMDLIWGTAGILCGAAVIFLWMKAKVSGLRALLNVREDERDEERRKSEILNERLDVLNRENKVLEANSRAMEKELSLLRKQTAYEAEMRDKQFGEQLKLVQEQLQNATREILGQRSQELSKQNTVQMTAIINPLKESIREMRTVMEHSRDTHNKNTASLEKAIEEVMKRTREIGEEADKLAHALRNESKVQGNWGELILDELLESQGLKEGIHYEKQVTLRDRNGNAILNEESGKRMIPDTVLHYPDGKDAVIDSKVSLTAFVDYQNARG